MPTRPTEVTLSPRECEPGALPPVCAKCGAPATGETAVTFGWFSKLLFVVLLFSPLVFLLVLLIVRKVRTVSMPVCPEHAGAWNRGKAIILGTTVACLTLLALAYGVADGGAGRFASALMLAVLLGLFLGIAVGLWTLSGGVQARLLTEDEIVLTRLHPDFVDAVENHSPERQAAYDALRAASKPRG